MLASWFRPLKRGRKNGSADSVGDEKKTKAKSKSLDAQSVGVGVRVVVVGGQESGKEVHKEAPNPISKVGAVGMEKNAAQPTKKGHHKGLRKSGVDVGSVGKSRNLPKLELDLSGNFEIDIPGGSPSPPPPSLATTPVRSSHPESITGDSGIDVTSKKSTTSSAGSASIPPSPSSAGSDGDSDSSPPGSSKNAEFDTITVVSKSLSSQFKAVLANDETDRICESPTRSVSPETELPQPFAKPARKRKPLPHPPSMPALGRHAQSSSSASAAARGMDKRTSMSSMRRTSLSHQPSLPILDVFSEAAAARMDLFTDISLDIPPPKIVPPLPTQNNTTPPTASNSISTASLDAATKPPSPAAQRNKRYSFIDTASGTAPAVPAGGRRGMSFGLGRKRDSILMAVEESEKDGEGFGITGSTAGHRLSSLLVNSNRSSYTGLPIPTSNDFHPSTRQPNASLETSGPRRSSRDPRPTSRSTHPQRFSSSTTTYTMPATSWYLPSSQTSTDYSPAVARRNLCAGVAIVLPGVYYGKKIGTKTSTQEDTTKAGPTEGAAAFGPTNNNDNKRVQEHRRLSSKRPHKSMPSLAAEPKPTPIDTSILVEYEPGPSNPRIVIPAEEPDVDAIVPAPTNSHSRKAYEPVPNPRWKGKGKEPVGGGVLVGVRA
ncbi:hypothetical protein HK097_006437 [Rhizophlyctis rosea]|uniref:Uncharacterized protein n=1 Tax=Rhizophlyctis rosea TaxID=64517 RepID=A0AAD5SE73_9FUNG|nr:hypothetical protein HK097_006437 [Rhizophlyctis rosea]